jgi:hypothetical protein
VAGDIKSVSDDLVQLIRITTGATGSRPILASRDVPLASVYAVCQQRSSSCLPEIAHGVRRTFPL